MGTKWDYYRQRRAIDVCKWSDHLKIKTYKDMCKYLLSIGVIPPQDDHDDVIKILSLSQRKEVKQDISKKDVSKTPKSKSNPKKRLTKKRTLNKTNKSKKM